ncbi:MAG: glycosyltransferase family 4 protein [Pseudomonadota bacterium]
MRVLIVSQYFWPESFRINDVAKTLVEKGMAVDVLTGQPNYPEGVIFEGYRAGACQQESWDGLNIHRVPMAPRRKRGALNLVFNYLSFVVSASTLGVWMLRGKRYDVILAYGTSPILQAIPALVIGWLKKRKVAIWVQDLWPESLEATGYVRSPRALAMVGVAVKAIYARTDLLLVQSQAFVPRVREMAGGTPVVYYPNSVDPVFSAAAGSPSPPIPVLDSDAFCVVFAGNIGAGQAVETIVDAATLLRGRPDIQFVVVGQGSRQQWMGEEATRRGLTNLHLPGRFSVELMPGLMQKASALLVTLTDQPIFAATIPNKIQAYMASGRPIIACLNGEGARVVAEAGAGLAVPAENAPALADAVLRLAVMTAGELAELGASGQRYFKAHFDHDMLTEQLAGHLRTLAESS